MIAPFITANRQRKARQKGAAVVEFALAVIVFFAVLFAIIEFGYLFWVNLTMQHAVREGARFAVTGRVLPDPGDPAENLNRCESAKLWIKENSMGLFDVVTSDADVTFSRVQPDGQIVSIGSGCGSPNDIIMINVDCAAPLLTPFERMLSLLSGQAASWGPVFEGGNYNFYVRATMKNEAFSNG
jgi:hypothetical protein